MGTYGLNLVYSMGSWCNIQVITLTLEQRLVAFKINWKPSKKTGFI